MCRPSSSSPAAICSVLRCQFTSWTFSLSCESSFSYDPVILSSVLQQDRHSSQPPSRGSVLGVLGGPAGRGGRAGGRAVRLAH